MRTDRGQWIPDNPLARVAVLATIVLGGIADRPAPNPLVMGGMFKPQDGALANSELLPQWDAQLTAESDCEGATAKLKPEHEGDVTLATINDIDTLILQLPWGAATHRVFRGHVGWTTGEIWDGTAEVDKPANCETAETQTSTPAVTLTAIASATRTQPVITVTLPPTSTVTEISIGTATASRTATQIATTLGTATDVQETPGDETPIPTTVVPPSSSVTPQMAKSPEANPVPGGQPNPEGASEPWNLRLIGGAVAAIIAARLGLRYQRGRKKVAG